MVVLGVLQRPDLTVLQRKNRRGVHIPVEIHVEKPRAFPEERFRNEASPVTIRPQTSLYPSYLQKLNQ